jgi:predicted RNase H-like nuclease
MSTILAIDAAWTEHNSSGIALLSKNATNWECLALAPSYEQFEMYADGQEVDWHVKPRGSNPNPQVLLEKAKKILGHRRVDLVTIDMPVSKVPIKTKRKSDHEISKTFAKNWCSTHSPNPKCPGVFGSSLSLGFEKLGYGIATVDTPVGDNEHLLEVYPHPAILKLLSIDKRLRYKVARRNRYWPKSSLDHRKSNLLENFKKLLDALKGQITNIDIPLPKLSSDLTFASLKKFEDVLDSLVCGWVGIQFLEKENIKAFGDSSSAIWVPVSQ